MNRSSAFKYFLIALIVLIILGVFNRQTVVGFFSMTGEPNERTTRTLAWRTVVGEDRHASFDILKGYYTGGAPNDDGGTIALDVMYPSKAVVPTALDRPRNENKVYILIKAGGEHTRGDNIKQLIDTQNLEARLGLKVDDQSTTSYTISPRTQNLQHEKTKIYLDAVRGHWIELRWKRTLMSTGEGIIKDQTASVYYHYADGLEANPIAMYQWVMDFVEHLQIKPHPTQTSRK